MTDRLEEALGRLAASIDLLETAVRRRLAVERSRGELETELQIMQDDRARLAVELDGASQRLNRFEAAADDLDRRVARAIGSIETVLAGPRNTKPAWPEPHRDPVPGHDE